MKIEHQEFLESKIVSAVQIYLYRLSEIESQREVAELFKGPWILGLYIFLEGGYLDFVDVQEDSQRNLHLSFKMENESIIPSVIDEYISLNRHNLRNEIGELHK